VSLVRFQVWPPTYSARLCFYRSFITPISIASLSYNIAINTTISAKTNRGAIVLTGHRSDLWDLPQLKRGIEFSLVSHDQKELGLEVKFNFNQSTPKEEHFIISLHGKSSNCEDYSGYIHYHFDKKSSELHIHELNVEPEGTGLGSVLLYLAAQHANALGNILLRTLFTAPSALDFYRKAGMQNDPTAPVETFSFEVEKKGGGKESKQIESTIELIATPKDCINKYKENIEKYQKKTGNTGWALSVVTPPVAEKSKGIFATLKTMLSSSPKTAANDPEFKEKKQKRATN
jgi:hypothetical protein